MEALAWSMIMTGCILFGMLGFWMIRRGLVRISTCKESRAVQQSRRQQTQIQKAI